MTQFLCKPVQFLQVSNLQGVFKHLRVPLQFLDGGFNSSRIRLFRQSLFGRAPCLGDKQEDRNQRYIKDEASEKVATEIPSPLPALERSEGMGECRVGVNIPLPPVPIRYRALSCTLVVQGLPPPIQGGGKPKQSTPHAEFDRAQKPFWAQN